MSEVDCGLCLCYCSGLQRQPRVSRATHNAAYPHAITQAFSAAAAAYCCSYHRHRCICVRRALMTGRQFARIGVPGVFMPSVNVGLPLNETTVGAQLKKASYATAAIGKWVRNTLTPLPQQSLQYNGRASAVRCDAT